MRNSLYSIGKAVSLLWFITLLCGFGKPLYAQTDTEFWFVVPEITRGHGHATYSPIGGIPSALKFSSSNLPSTVTVTMPADTEGHFPPIVVNLGAYDFFELSLDYWINAGTFDRDWLENKPLTPSGINNFGLHITATAPITAYYEVNNYNNKDIWALKGRNGLGTEFFTPFQNQGINGSYNPQPTSAIDVVAIEDGTVVTFHLVPGKRASFGLPPSHVSPGGTKTVTLNKGQTFSLFPYNRGQNPNDRLVGTRITSTNPIAVTITDDSHRHTTSTCNDVSGDQLIPTQIFDPHISANKDLIGKEYIAMRTDLTNQDNLYILATQNNTNIRVYNPAGLEVINQTINARDQIHQPLPNTAAYYRIVADEPIYVLHIGGFGCEVGGAILPPIDKCTGVPRVAFARTSDQTFYIVIMVRKGAEDGFEFNGAVRNDLFPPSSFAEVDNSDWSVRRFGPFTTGQAGVGTHFMRNTKDIFHLGIVNGGASTGCFYGYFSNYNEFYPEALVIETEATGNRICAGESVQLWANGGTSYLWEPSTYLDDPTSETPIAHNVLAPINYKVTIGGACGKTEDEYIDIQAAGPISASFKADPNNGCAQPPIANPAGIPQVTFNFTSTSTGDEKRWWRWKLGPTGTEYDFHYGADGDLDDARTATLSLENNSDTIATYYIILRTSDENEICFQEIERAVKVYPYIDINPMVDINLGCHPLDVQFTANPIGHYNGATYLWEFGDGGSDNVENPTHTYNNVLPPYNIVTYTDSTTITDQWNVCKVTKSVDVTVHPMIEPMFTVNQIEGCSPLDATITDVSKGGITSYEWWVNGGLTSSTATPPDFSNLENNRTDNAVETFVVRLVVRNSFGCTEMFERTIRVFPNPNANITVTPQGDVACSPLLVNFNAASIINHDAYAWMLDGIPISSNASGSYTLDNYTATTQTREFSFVVTNNWGCRFDSDTIPVAVHPFVKAKIMIDDEEGCSPHSPSITDASNIGVTSWNWTITSDSDVYTGTTQTAPVFPPFIYPGSLNESFTPHYVTVDLVVENIAGCVSTDHKTIQVNPTAQATFTADFYNFENLPVDPNTQSLCSPVTADFTGNYSNAEDYYWTFGSFGASLDENPTGVEFSNTGTAPENVEVTLLATNRFGCSAPPYKRPYTILPEITAAFSMVADGSCVPVTIDVQAQTIYGVNPQYSWTQDGAPWGHFQNDTLIISNNSTGADRIVTIQLRVDDGECYDISPVFQVIVHPEVEAKWDLADVPAPTCSPYELNITNTSTLLNSTSSINSATGYINWSITNSLNSTITTGSNDNFHRFINNDSHLTSQLFDLSLTATSMDGCSDTKTATIEVYPKATAQFNVETTDICTPMELLITNASLTTSGSTYTWDWDGGTPTNVGGQNYTVTYTNPDPNNTVNRIITMDLVNSYGCTDQSVFLLSVLPQVNASFALAAGSDPYHCGEGDVTFNNLSSGGSLNYLWLFDDGQHYTTTNTNPVTHSFNNTGQTDAIYNVRLIAENIYACSDQHTIPITVHPKVEANFSFTIPDQCAYPLQVDFVNNSKFAAPSGNINTSFNWNYGYTWGGVPQADSRPNSNPHSYAFYNDLPNATRTYTISLNPQQHHLVSGLTCQDTETRTITVYPELIANFSLDNAEGCNPLTVGYTNTSTGVMQASGGYYNWDYGDSSGGTASNPANKVYSHFDKTQAITYPVHLTITNPLGCTKDLTRNVVVYPWVESAFSIDRFEGCTPLDIDVTNLSKSPAYTYQWNFTGGTPSGSTSADPGTITYINPLAPPATLSVLQNTLSLVTGLNTSLYPVGSGCVKSASHDISVFPHVYPSFDGDLAGCHPLDINFTNTSGVFGGTNNGQYVWTFGTGVVSNNMNHSQTYLNPSLTTNQIYTGELKAISQHGCKDSIDFSVVVYPKPQSRMELVSDYMACSPFPAEIQNLSIGKGMNTTLAFHYDFGDGSDLTTFSMANVIHPFQNLSSDIVPYLITLHVETEDGCEDTSYQTIHVYPEVTAQFAFDPGDAACNPFTVQHINSSTNAWYYEWNFDDGGFLSYLHSPTHLYQNFTENDQVFNVVLTAMSEYDCMDTYTLPLTVYATPDADFAINPPLKVYPDATFEFLNQTFPAADSWQYRWTFGDGYGSTQKHPTPHTYETWGPIADDFKYLVRLEVENDHCFDAVEHTLILRPAAPIPMFDANQYEACSPLVVYFENNSQYGHSYEWDFGDGTTSTEREPTHTYYEAGYYNVSLKVIGDGGERYYFAVFQVFENPVADFVVTPEVAILPDATVHIYNLSEKATSYFWDVGDGTTYISRDVVHRYQEMGEYRIKLIAYTDNACVDSTSRFPAVWVRGAGFIRFPNAFVPSKVGPSGGQYDDVDYKNEIFHPVYHAVVEYKLMIFNRWGEQIFESNDIKVGWDGYYNGKLSSQDVYVYRAVGKYSNGQTFNVRGNVTLLR